MNTKGMKFLAVLAVLAMAFAAFAIITDADDNDAATTPSGKWSYATQGPLDFAYTITDSDYSDNVTLKNNILVSYDSTAKKYTVTGTIAYYANTGTDPLAKLGMPASTHYGLAFLVKYDGTHAYTVKIGDIGAESPSLKADDPSMLSFSKAGTAKVVITSADSTYKGTYTIDYSGVTLVSSSGTNPTVGYVAFPNANALAAVEAAWYGEARTVSGTDGMGGKWTFVQEASGGSGAPATLTLDNYNGVEYFKSAGLKTIVIKGNNTITLTSAAVAETAGLYVATTGAVSIQTTGGDASLTINNAATLGYGIYTSGGDGENIVTIGNVTASNGKLTLNVTADDRAIYCPVGLTIVNAKVTATGGEKCIDSSKGALTITGSEVNAFMGPRADNLHGTSYRFALRGGAISFTNSTIFTEGLANRHDAAAPSLTLTESKVTVSGDYVQVDSTGDLKKMVAGLYYLGAAPRIAYTSTPADTSYILLTDNAGVYGNVEVKGSGTEIVQENEVVNAEPATAAAKQEIVDNINESDAKTVQLVIDGNIDVDLAAATPIVVSENKSLNIVNNGTGSVTANVKIDTKTIKLEDIKGAVEISKGSIKIYGDPWSAGTITLNDGDVAKVSGTVGAVTFDYDGPATGKATILVEKNTALTITTSLTIASANISMEIEGTVTADAVGKDLNNDESKIIIKDGAVVEKIDITGTGDIEVYSGSDINGIGSITNWDKVKGKDAASGKWSVNAAKTILTLDNYNGTYNFMNFRGTLTTINLVGDSVVSFAFPATYPDEAAFNLFGNASITSITTSTSGSLEIDVDVSKVAGDKLFTTAEKVFTVISGTTVDINGVDIAINVFGTNGDWTADQKKAANVIGIASTTFNTYNAGVEMDILSSFTAAGVKGLAATGIVTIGTGYIDIAAAGTALDSDAAVTISNTTIVSLDGKKVGLKTTEDAVTIQSVPLMSVSGGIDTRVEAAGALTVKESNIAVAGASDVASISETNSSDVEFTGKLIIGAVTLTQNSTLSMKDAIINGVITNGGNIITKGNVIINADSHEFGNDANSTFVNDGTIALFGKIANKGQFTNNGSLTVFADAIAYAANTITVSADLPADATKARLGSITIPDAASIKSINADGTATVKATLTFQFKEGDAFVGVDLDKFEGTLTPSQTDAGFTLALSNGSASVTVVYDASKAGYVVGESYTITVSGAIKDAENNLRYLEANKTGTEAATITAHTIDALMTPSNADFTATAGKITSTGSFTIYSPATATIATEFEGDLVADIATKLNINGKFTGNITSNGASEVSVTKVTAGNITAKGDVTMSGTLTGNIVSDAKVSITGTMTGDITAKDDVSVTKKQIGNITVNANDKKLTVNGEVDGILTYNSAYKATKDAKAGEETTYTATMAIKGTGNFIINLAAGADATASTEVVPGSFTFQSMAAVEDKSTEMKLTAGKLGVPADFTIPVGYSLIIEAGTTIEVAKTATLNVEKSALKVSKDATANFETGSAIAVTYGKVSFVMSFTIEGGAYTIYSNVAYALSNCDENSELTVGKSDVATANIDVKKGVNIIVDSVTLDFDDYALTMADGAKITLVGTGKVVFKATGDNKAGLAEEDEYVFYTVSGTFVYDDDNIIELDAVRFTAESQIVGVAATEAAPSKISATLLYNEGIATVAAGYGTGSITIDNFAYAMTKADEAAVPAILTQVFGTFEISEDAVFDAIALNDDFGVVQYKDTAAGLVVDKIVQMPTIVTIEGTLNLLNSTIVKGVYAGPGKVTLAATKSLTIAAGGLIDDVEVDRNSAPSITVQVVDTTDNENGYAFALVSPRLTDEEAATIVITAEKYKDADVMTLAGKIGIGIIAANNAAYLKAVALDEDAAITADTTYIIGAGASTATGYLATKEIFMKVGAAASEYQTLNYEVTFEEDGYTIYTCFATVDFDEISDITIAGNEEEYSLQALAGGILVLKLDLSGKDVNITVAEDKVLIIDIPLTIGTPITVLGSEGSSIVGTIWIEDDSYLVAYADVDLSEAEILGDLGLADAVYSTLTIEDVLYATIFANEDDEDVELADVDKKIIPVIIGYNFTKWNNLNEDVHALVGETNAYAAAKAVLVSVTVKFAEGVTYYKNGVEFAIYDTPTKVDYGSVFTAKINNTAKYQGTPLINGQNSYIVEDDATLTVSGVTPITPEPQPEPEVGGISLTDILLIVLVILIAVMVVIMVLRLNRS